MSVYLGDNIKGMLEVMNLRFISDNDSPFHGQPSLYLFITSSVHISWRLKAASKLISLSSILHCIGHISLSKELEDSRTREIGFISVMWAHFTKINRLQDMNGTLTLRAHPIVLSGISSEE